MIFKKKNKAQSEPQAGGAEGPPDYPVEYEAGGPDDVKLANMMQCKQSPAFPFTKELFYDAVMKRAENILLDCTAQAVGVRYEIDGMWHNVQPRGRDVGDPMIAVLKKIANLRPEDRRSKQEGEFKVAVAPKKKKRWKIVSQGVQTGERVVLKLLEPDTKLESLEDLGMREKMREQFKELINADTGLILMCAPPQGGLSALWRGAVQTADRFLRDFISIEDVANPVDEIVNVGQETYNRATGETPATILPKLLLKEPEVIFFPDIPDGGTVDAMCDQVAAGRLTAGTIRAKEAVEALLRVLMLKPNTEKFAKTVTAVLNQRLCRRLCEKCKQGFQPQPQLLQKLGIPPGRIAALYREYQPPPPDPNSKDEPPPPCQNCGTLGYFGRTGIFELLVVNDNIRQALITQPKLDVLRRVAKQSGHRSLQDEAILTLCQGVTSLPEIQRVLK